MQRALVPTLKFCRGPILLERFRSGTLFVFGGVSRPTPEPSREQDERRRAEEWAGGRLEQEVLDRVADAALRVPLVEVEAHGADAVRFEALHMDSPACAEPPDALNTIPIAAHVKSAPRSHQIGRCTQPRHSAIAASAAAEVTTVRAMPFA